MEELILVDESDQPTGSAEKMDVHRQGLLHRAFLVFIFDKRGRLLLQQRASNKYHSPDLWSNSCCGHPRLGDTTRSAARRRLTEEMGLDCSNLTQVDAFIYREQVSDELVEHEYDHVFVGASDISPQINPDEVRAWKWVSLSQLERQIRTEPDVFTTRFLIILRQQGISALRDWRAQLRRHLNRLASRRKTFSMPDSLKGLTLALSPHVEEAERHTRQWLKRIGLENNAHAQHQLDIYKTGTYAGYMWPSASLEDLQILAMLTGWFSCQDDLADEDLCQSPELLEKAIRQAHAAASGIGELSGSALARGLTDIISRASAHMPMQWRQRTLEQYASYLYPCLRAAMHRIEGTQPTRLDYESLWRTAGGFQVCLEFTYYVIRLHLPSHIYYSSAWQELCRLSLNLMKAVNDQLSFLIMENPFEDVYNLVTHLIHHHGCSPDAAALRVRRQIEIWSVEFFALQQRLPAELDRLGCDPAIREQALHCAELFKVQWQGNIGWHQVVPRYRENRFDQ